MIDREEYIELVRQLQEIRERVEACLDLIVPQSSSADGTCPHPVSAVVDDSSMGEPLFRCTRCGATQTTPFLTL